MSETLSHIRHTLIDLQKDLFDLSARNPLIQVNPDRLWFTDDQPNPKNVQKIYQKARFFEKEYGLHTTLFVSHFLTWKKPNEATFFSSPLLCKTTTIVEKKREDLSYSFSEKDETIFVNPLLRKLFQEIFDLALPEFVDTPETLINLLAAEFKQLTFHTDFQIPNTWQLVTKNAVGIFNYKKLLLARDYEKIVQNPGNALLNLFGEKKKKDDPPFKITGSPALDGSQKKAIEQSLVNHTVIQGPPGTGKSHTLVALIKTLLAQQKKVLFVSEKRSALEVVFQRLKKEKLDMSVAFFNPDKDEKKQFYSHLKKTWEWASANRLNPIAISEATGDQHPQLSYYPQKLVADLKIGTTIQAMIAKLVRENFEPIQIEIELTFPDYKLWLENVEKLAHFESSFKNHFNVKLVSDPAFFSLNTAVFSEPDPIRKLSVRIEQLEKSLQKIQVLVKTYKLPENPKSFLNLAIAASILAMVNKNQLDLLQKDHKNYKAFNTLSKKYQLTKNKLNQVELANQKWSKKPSLSEITEITDSLKQQKKSKNILRILKRNSARSINYFTDFSPTLSTVAKLQLLEEIRMEWHLRGELEALKIKLKHEFHLLNPDTEIDHILNVRSKLERVSQHEYVALLEHPDSLALITSLSGIHDAVNHLNNLLIYLFYKSDFSSFNVLKLTLNQLKNELELMDQFQYELTVFFKTPESILNFIRTHKDSIQELDNLITWKQLQDETRFEPQFKKMNGASLLIAFEAQKSSYKKAMEQETARIQFNPANQLNTLEKLAETPASKLTPEARVNKQKFKEARRTLVHEFSKKQQHLPVIELMQQHAATVLSLQPVWMMNPLSVAQFLPCEEGIFDYVIFDESSQVPLEDAIPAIFRGAKMVIVGDSQQMPPGHFFSANPAGKTVLDQAEFNFTNVMLIGHYRSEHPGLIAFSNKHFYDSELTTLPPVSAENPVRLIHVSGTFEDNRNSIEAREISNYYRTLLEQGKTDIGIIAFSKEQQSEIEKQIASLRLPENESLLIRNLENVQGIEKEIILISIGYAKNREGIFKKNFGPVNRERGANRLNVLFTRAIEKMIVFSSVSSADFVMSDNPGVTVLADFIRYCEDQKNPGNSHKFTAASHQFVLELLTENECVFNYYAAENGIAVSCFVQHETGKILLVDPCTQPTETKDLFNLLHALEKRFSKIKVILSTDLLHQKDYTEKEILDFFRIA